MPHPTARHTLAHAPLARLPYLAAFLLALLTTTAAFADGPANPLDRGDHGQASNADPADAPDWVVPGARLTYFVGSSTTPKNPRQNDTRAGSGMGFRQYDIVAITPQGVLFEHRDYFLTEPGADPQLMSSDKRVADFATGGGLWMSPDAIAATQPTNDPNANPHYAFAPIEIEGDTYDALHVTARSEDGNTVFRRVYDRQTGIELYHSDQHDNAETKSASHAQFRGYRVAQLPWQGTEFTPQIQQLRKLTFLGAMILEAPPAPGLEPIPDTRSDFEAEFAFEDITPIAIHARLTMRTRTPGQRDQPPVEQLQWISPNQRLGMYIDPATLAGLEQGQVLDEDPIIGYRIVVTDVFEVQGITLVEITEIGRRNNYQNQSTYDASVGLQVASVWTKPLMSQRIEVHLEAVE